MGISPASVSVRSNSRWLISLISSEGALALPLQAVDLVLRGLVLWPGFQGVDLFSELQGALLVRLPLFQEFFEGFGEPHAQAVDLVSATHKVTQTLVRLGVEVRAQEIEKRLEQSRLVGQHMVEKGEGKAARVSSRQGIEGSGRLIRQGGDRDAAPDPVIQTEGEQLAAQHLRGAQKHAGRGHLTGQHFVRLLEEVQVMRAVAIGQGRGHGVAIAAASPADALQKTGLVGWDGTQQHRRQVADVHAHLQRRCG